MTVLGYCRSFNIMMYTLGYNNIIWCKRIVIYTYSSIKIIVNTRYTIIINIEIIIVYFEYFFPYLTKHI